MSMRWLYCRIILLLFVYETVMTEKVITRFSVVLIAGGIARFPFYKGFSYGFSHLPTGPILVDLYRAGKKWQILILF